MIKKIISITLGSILIFSILAFTCSCSLLSKPLGKRTGFTDNLDRLENNIRDEKWDNAKTSLEDSRKAWKKLKPMLQVDIDHDYVNDLEENLTKLGGYIDTKEKPDSLATVLLIKDIWDNIGSM